MKKKVVVISLGGSLIIPDKVDVNFLSNFKKVIKNNLGKYKFIIVCGGGSIARKIYFCIRKQKNKCKTTKSRGNWRNKNECSFYVLFF